MKATLYKTDGTKEEIKPHDGKSFGLSEMQKFVGGYVEMYRSVDGKQLILMNEDGRSLNLPINHYATGFCLHLNMREGIRGNVVVCDPELFD